VTTDGSISDFDRAAYIPAEERVVQELKEIGKPFIIVINSTDPEGEAAQKLKAQLHEKYQVGCEAVNCQTLDENGVESLLKAVLCEFPLREIRFTLPKWTRALLDKQEAHPIMTQLCQELLEKGRTLEKLWQITPFTEELAQSGTLESVTLGNVQMGQGQACVDLSLPRSLYYELLTEACGQPITDEGELIPVLRELKSVYQAYERISTALEQVEAVGYGIVMPDISELRLEEPEIVRQGGRFGVKLRASAPSLHLIRVDIQTEVCPVVGTEQQSEEMIRYLMDGFEQDPQKLWSSNLFGKPLSDLVREGLSNKLMHMPADTQLKVQQTLEKIINEGSGGMVCILL